ncbi:MAG TPA: heme biosynthesis HemY N-terminal domain-containing protein [Geminicoccaceae bacterium]
MLRLIFFLLVAIALSLLATWFADNPGQVSLEWLGMRIETSVAVMIIAVLVVALIVTVVIELLRMLSGAPRHIKQRRRTARLEQGYQALSQGMVAAAAGDAAAAKHLTRRAEKLLDNAPSTLLLSAQAAQLDGDETQAHLRFQQMLKHRETEFLGLRGLLSQAIKEGDIDTALRLARRAYLRRPNTPWVLTTLFDLQTRSERWTEALSTVGDMARYKVIDRDTATRRRAILFHQAAAEQRAAGRPYEALATAQKAHKLLPSLAPIAVQASDIAEQVSKPRVARKILETAWKARPHPAVARAYLALHQEQPPAERLKLVERLYQSQPDHLEGELVLAEAALSAKDWKVARAALERALKLEATASVYRLMAELEQAENHDPDKARAWLARAVDAPPDPAWVCESTGEMRATWSPFGPDGRFDSLRWGSPPKIIPLARAGAEAELIPPGSAPRATVAAAAPGVAGRSDAAAAAGSSRGAVHLPVATVAGPDATHDTRDASVAQAAKDEPRVAKAAS